MWRVLRHLTAADDTTCLRKLFPDCVITQRTIDAFVEELIAFTPLQETVRTYTEQTPGTLQQKIRGPGRGAAVLLYVAARIAKPIIVLETDCFTGWTSALLLSALHHNEVGHLFSIDLPAKAGQFGLEWGLPDGISSGFLVPELLRNRWSLCLGNITRELMPLLDKEPCIDLFYHDADHSYQHMMWEYCTVWPSLRPGGLLVSDDIGWNTAFRDFAAASRCPWTIHRSNPNLGALRKSVDAQ